MYCWQSNFQHITESYTSKQQGSYCFKQVSRYECVICDKKNRLTAYSHWYFFLLNQKAYIHTSKNSALSIHHKYRIKKNNCSLTFLTADSIVQRIKQNCTPVTFSTDCKQWSSSMQKGTKTIDHTTQCWHWLHGEVCHLLGMGITCILGSKALSQRPWSNHTPRILGKILAYTYEYCVGLASRCICIPSLYIQRKSEIGTDQNSTMWCTTHFKLLPTLLAKMGLWLHTTSGDLSLASFPSEGATHTDSRK